MRQQVLLKVMVASGVMKTLIPPKLPQIGTPIHKNHPQQRKQTPENMEAVASVSACKEASWSFSADFTYYPMKMSLSQILQTCANYDPFALSSLFITQRVLPNFMSQ